MLTKSPELDRKGSEQGRPQQVRCPIGSTYAVPYLVACAELSEGTSRHNDRNR